LPDRNDFDQDPRMNDPRLTPNGPRYRRAGGSGWAWWWVWFLVLFCAFIWFAGWGWGNYGGWWWGTRGNGPTFAGRTYNSGNGPRVNNRGAVPANTPTNGASNATILQASNKRQFEGQPLELTNTPVIKTVSKEVFWVSPKNSAPLLVVANGNAAIHNAIRQGEAVDVTGTVEKAPAATDAKDWGLDQAGIQRLEQQGVYVSASQATGMQQQ
jgi:hypothetical protein